MRGGNKPKAQGGPVSTSSIRSAQGPEGTFQGTEPNPLLRALNAPVAPQLSWGCSTPLGAFTSSVLHPRPTAPPRLPQCASCLLPWAAGALGRQGRGPVGLSGPLPPSSLSAARALLPSIRREGGGPGGSHTGIVVPGEGGRGCFPVSVCSVQRGFPPACSGFGLKSHSSSSGIREARNKGDSLNCAS